MDTAISNRSPTWTCVRKYWRISSKCFLVNIPWNPINSTQSKTFPRHWNAYNAHRLIWLMTSKKLKSHVISCAEWYLRGHWSVSAIKAFLQAFKRPWDVLSRLPYCSILVWFITSQNQFECFFFSEKGHHVWFRNSSRRCSCRLNQRSINGSSLVIESASLMSCMTCMSWMSCPCWGHL